MRVGFSSFAKRGASGYSFLAVLRDQSRGDGGSGGDDGGGSAGGGSAGGGECAAGMGAEKSSWDQKRSQPHQPPLPPAKKSLSQALKHLFLP